MSAGDSIDIAALVERAQQRRPSRHCWASRLEGKAAEYVTAIEAAIGEGATVTYSQVARDLADVFGIDMGDSQVRRHFRKECRCRKR